jgi:hypothetical protein
LDTLLDILLCSLVGALSGGLEQDIWRPAF